MFGDKILRLFLRYCFILKLKKKKYSKPKKIFKCLLILLPATYRNQIELRFLLLYIIIIIDNIIDLLLL